MDRRELEIMLNEAFDRGIVSVGHLVHETVEVGFLNELGRTVGFTLNGCGRRLSRRSPWTFSIALTTVAEGSGS